MLPEGKGYLEAHFYKDKADVYWVGHGLRLESRARRRPWQMPAPTTYADAQYGFSFEVAWWTKYTDAH